MTTQFAGHSLPPIMLNEDAEAAMCRQVAELELSGDFFAATILKDQFDLDDVWIEDYKAEIDAAHQ